VALPPRHTARLACCTLQSAPSTPWKAPPQPRLRQVPRRPVSPHQSSSRRRSSCVPSPPSPSVPELTLECCNRARSSRPRSSRATTPRTRASPRSTLTTRAATSSRAQRTRRCSSMTHAPDSASLPLCPYAQLPPPEPVELTASPPTSLSRLARRHLTTIPSKKYGAHLARFTHTKSTMIHASTKENGASSHRSSLSASSSTMQLTALSRRRHPLLQARRQELHPLLQGPHQTVRPSRSSSARSLEPR